jgi:hypothetical protein
MRNIDATLEGYQQDATRTPDIFLRYHNGQEWVDISAYKKAIRYLGEPYGCFLKVTLDNSTGAFDSWSSAYKSNQFQFRLSLNGYTPYVIFPSMWVYRWYYDSHLGASNFVLICDDIWGVVNRYGCQKSDLMIGHEAYWDASEGGTKTIRQISDAVLDDMGITLYADEGQDDGKLNTVKPAIFTVKLGEKGISVIRRLEQRTSMVLRPTIDGLRWYNPQPEGTPDYTYNGDHAHYTFQGGEGVFTPNWVKARAYWTDDTGTFQQVIGEAQYDSDSKHFEFIDYPNYEATEVEMDGICDAVIDRAELNSRTGSFTAPANLAQECYDTVRVIDSRSGQDGTGCAGPFIIEWNMDDRRFDISSDIGGLHFKDDEMDDAVGDLKPVLPTLEGRISGDWIRPYTTPTEALYDAMEDYIVDLTFSSTGRQNVTWTAGKIYIGANQVLNINAGSHGLGAYPSAEFCYFERGNSTLQWTSNSWEINGRDRGLVAFAKAGGASDDKAYVGPLKAKEPVLSSVLFYADIVRSAFLQANSVLAGHIAAGEIKFNHLEGVPSSNVIANPCLEFYDSDPAYDCPEWTGLGSGKGTGGTGVFRRYVTDDWGRCATSGINVTVMRIHSDTVDNLECHTVMYRANEGEVWGALGWARAQSLGQDDQLRIAVSFRKKDGSIVDEKVSDWLGATSTYTQMWIQHKAPPETYYVRLEVHVSADATWEGYWFATDFNLFRASLLVLQGTPGGNRTEISPDGLEGYHGAARTIWVRSADGYIRMYDGGMEFWSKDESTRIARIYTYDPGDGDCWKLETMPGASIRFVTENNILVWGKQNAALYGGHVVIRHGTGESIGFTRESGMLDIRLSGIPTSYPGETTRIWSDGGTLKIGNV